MINLKTITLTEAEKQALERAMRKSSLKRTWALDFISTISDMGSNKLFLGYDGKRNIQFSRLRTSFEKFMPRIIIIIPKDRNEREYRLRYSLISTIVVGFFAFALIFTAAISLVNKYNYDGIIFPLFFMGCFVLLTLLELKIVDKRIKKALINYP